MSEPESRVVAIIPARYHSNRFEGKPIMPINGKPMIQHVVERAWRVPMLSRVAVATDDERIASLLAQGAAGAPDMDVTADDGIRHTFWVVDDDHEIKQLQDLFARLDYLYVADGHHRSAAATRVKQMRQK